jgi:4'-phosphopantetheinyl transferase
MIGDSHGQGSLRRRSGSVPPSASGLARRGQGVGNDSCDLWWARRTDSREGLKGLLDDAEAVRFRSFVRQADRERFLVGCALAKLVLSRYLTDQSARDIRFVRRCSHCGGHHGKPHLQTRDPEFSISHSGDLVVVAVANVAVGVDVEQIPWHVPRGLVKMALSKHESAALSRLPSPERPRSFTRSWTQKEAVSKATGAGVNLDPRAIIIDPTDPPRLLDWPHSVAPQDVALFTRTAPRYIVSAAAIGGLETIRHRNGVPLLARHADEDLAAWVPRSRGAQGVRS